MTTMTSTWQDTSSSPAKGLAAASVLDDEVGEEDIGHLGWLENVAGVLADRLLEGRLALGGHELIGGLLGSTADALGAYRHALLAVGVVCVLAVMPSLALRGRVAYRPAGG